MSEIRNAIIESTCLGLEDHGIFSAYLHLKYDGSGQSFGGYALDQFVKATREREGTAYGMEFIRRILATVGVESWEELKGKHLRADCEHHKIHGIGHIIEDRWFYPEKDLKAYIPHE